MVRENEKERKQERKKHIELGDRVDRMRKNAVYVQDAKGLNLASE